MKFVGRTYYLKMLKNIKEFLINKEKLNKLTVITLYLLLITYLINTLYFSNNLKELTIKLFGSWNPLVEVKEKVFFYFKK